MRWIIIALLLLTGCEKKYYPKEYISPRQIIYDGYLTNGASPKVIPLAADWKDIDVYIYGDDDKLIPLPATMNGVTQYYLIDMANNELELFIQGWIYKIYITY